MIRGRVAISAMVMGFLVFACVLGGTTAGGQRENQRTAAQVVADQWGPPGAPKSEAETATAKTIIVRTIVHNLPFGKIWQYYADKCGLGKTYAARQLYVINGKRNGGEYLWQDEAATCGDRCCTHYCSYGRIPLRQAGGQDTTFSVRTVGRLNSATVSLRFLDIVTPAYFPLPTRKKGAQK